jgi:hypothetical protein
MDFDRVVPHPLDEEEPGGIVWNPASTYVKEMRRWEQFPSEYTVKSKPGNPYVYRAYPKMLYKAQRMPNGQYTCLSAAPDPYLYQGHDDYNRACLMVETFNRSCTRIVTDESAERIAIGQGWAEDPSKAMAQYEAEQQAIGNAAAEAAFSARRMTEKAREEYAEAEQQTHEHVTDVVPTKTRGRHAVRAKVGSADVDTE